MIATFAWAPVGLIVFALAHHRVAFRTIRPWLWAAMIPVPLVLHQLVLGRAPWALVAFLVLVLAGGAFLRADRWKVFGAGVAVLSVCVAYLALERSASTRTWHEAGGGATGVARILDSIGGTESLGAGAYSRYWSSSPAADLAHVDVDIRLVRGTPNTAWIEYHPDFRIEARVDDGVPYSRITPPEDGASYVTRRVDTGSAIGGRRFRARMELRAPAESVGSGCTGIVLREVRGSGARACFPVRVASAWEGYEVEWTTPSTATSPILRVELRIPGTFYDVRGVRLEELRGDAWIALDPLEPTGVWISVAVPGQDRLFWPAAGLLPTDDWQTLRLDEPIASAQGRERIRTVLEIEDGLVVDVRGAQLTYASGRSADPQPSPPRQSAWYVHPNLAAHALVTSGLAVAVASPTAPLGLAAAGLALVTLLFTASRTAGLALLIGTAWWLWLRAGPRIRVAMAIAAALGSLLALVVGLEPFATARLLQLEDTNAVARSEIARFAWDGMIAHPWRGVGEGGFSEAWKIAHPDDARVAPTHAHNFWLHWAATYGVPGLAAALLFTFALVATAWRAARWLGIALTVPVLVMQVFDYTLVYSNVLLVLIFALNTLRADDVAATPAGDEKETRKRGLHMQQPATGQDGTT